VYSLSGQQDVCIRDKQQQSLASWNNNGYIREEESRSRRINTRWWQRKKRKREIKRGAGGLCGH